MAIKAPPTAPYTFTRVRTKITDVEIAQAAYNAGFRGDGLTKIIAIAIAESHGNTTAVNDRNEFSVGLWQINVNGYLVSRLQRWGMTSWQELWDPDKAAKAAYQISGGGKRFRAWSVYNHNTYLRYMDRATAAANTVSTPKPTTGGTTNSTANNTYTPVQRSNILPPVNTQVNADPMAIIIVVGVIGIVIVGLMLMMKQRGN